MSMAQQRHPSSHRAYHGFPSSVSPTIIPFACVKARFASTSSQVRTFPLLTIGILIPESSAASRSTSRRSAAPCLRRRADTVRACSVIQDAPAASKRRANVSVCEAGWQRRSFAETGTGRECERFDTEHDVSE